MQKKLFPSIFSLFLVTPSFADNHLFDLSLQELMNLEVSIASRTDEPIKNTSAAVTVITQQQIQQSGFTQLPNVLRLVPGLHVGRIDSNKWWVSIRGFGVNRFNSQLQVMIDGRNIFTPLFNGTYWEHHMPPLKDIEKIEVVRGPGGAVWGNNAVSGVINIITKNSADTQGEHLSLLAGTDEVDSAAYFRSGFSFEKTTGRVYIQQNNHSGGELTDVEQVTSVGLNSGDDGDDEWTHNVLGFRTDTRIDNHTLIFSGEVFDAEYDQTRISLGQPSVDTVDAKGKHLKATWRWAFDENNSFSLDGFIDTTERQDASFEEKRTSSEVTVQYDHSSDNNQFTTGYSYSSSDDETEKVSSFVFFPADKNLDYQGVFLQNTHYLLDRKASITAGIRYDENEYTGWEHQPTLRGFYQFNDHHSMWASISRAVRIPGRSDVEAFLDFSQPPLFVIPLISIGNPNQIAVELVANEIGYRFNTEYLSVDLALFYNEFDNLVQDVFSEGQDVDLFGGEINITKQWTNKLTTSLQYSYHNNKDDEYSPNSFGESGIDNLKQLSGLQVNWRLSDVTSFNVMGFYNTDPLPEEETDGYSSNFRVDFNIQHRVSKNLNLIFAGQNLLDDADTQVLDSNRLNTGVKRAYFVKAEIDW